MPLLYAHIGSLNSASIALHWICCLPTSPSLLQAFYGRGHLRWMLFYLHQRNIKAKTNICVCVCVCACTQLLSRVGLFVSSRTVAHQDPLSMGFSRQEYWSGCHALLQGIFPTQGSNLHLMSPALVGVLFCFVLFLPLAPPGKTWYTTLTKDKKICGHLNRYRKSICKVSDDLW